MSRTFDQQVNLLTILGGTPFIALLILPKHTWIAFQFIGIMYLGVIISFIAGINWLMACQRQQRTVLLWSIVLSLACWLVMTLSWYLTANLWGWLGLWLLLNMAYCIDYQLYRQDKLLSQLRLSGTITLNIAVVAIIVRTFWMHLQ